MLNADFERVYYIAQEMCRKLTKEEFQSLNAEAQKLLIELAVFCGATNTKWWVTTQPSNSTQDNFQETDSKRYHNCWECQSDNCFNKTFPPKESNAGLDCVEWK